MKYGQLRFLSISFFIINIVYSNLEYQSVRLYNPTKEKIEVLSVLGVPLDHSSGKKGYYIDFVTNSEQLEELELRNFNIEILIPNLAEYYKSRNIPEEARDFPLGSMQGNYTLSELSNRFDELQELYPNLISERVDLKDYSYTNTPHIHETYEGRFLQLVKISDNPGTDEEEEPQILYTALHHAREPGSMQQLIYFMWYLRAFIELMNSTLM